MKKAFIYSILIITLLSSICWAGESQNQTWDEKLNKGLFRLTFDAFNNYPQIEDQIYTVGDDSVCELYFRFTQFMEPNFLVFAYLPGKDNTCLGRNLGSCREFWSLANRRIAFVAPQKMFEELRTDEIDYTGKSLKNLNLGIGMMVRVVKIIKIELSNGRISSMPILRILPEEK